MRCTNLYFIQKHSIHIDYWPTNVVVYTEFEKDFIFAMVKFSRIIVTTDWQNNITHKNRNIEAIVIKTSLRYFISFWKTKQVTFNRSTESTYLHSALFVAFERFPALPLFNSLHNTNSWTLECWPWPITELTSEGLRGLSEDLIYSL